MRIEDLDLELKEALEAIGNLDPSSEDYTAAVKNFDILHKCKMENEKIVIEKEKLKNERMAKRMDAEIREKEIKLEAKNSMMSRIQGYVKIVISCSSAVGVGLIVCYSEEVAGKILTSKAANIATKLINIV